MKRLGIAVSVVFVACGCSDGRPDASPISPTVTRAPDPTFTVSGVVVGQGSAPVEGALVRVAGQSGTTDGAGYYSLQGVPKSYGGASAVKAGYAAAREILTVSGDTRFDVQLGPRVAIHALAGVISEATPAGLVPIEGVQVSAYSCEDVPPLPPFFSGSCLVSISQTTSTDRKGLYSFPGLYAGKKNFIGLSKEGFADPRVDPNGHEGDGHEGEGQEVTINGDTRLDLQLVRQ